MHDDIKNHTEAECLATDMPASSTASDVQSALRLILGFLSATWHIGQQRDVSSSCGSTFLPGDTSKCQILDSDLVQKFLKDYTILAKMAKTLFSVGSQVMWESSVMKKLMQLQNRHSPYLSLV